MKQLPDILTSASFWGSIATMWAAAGAWFTYVAAEVASRQRTYAGILNLIEGLEVELDLISGWAAGGEGNKGYLSNRTLAQLTSEHRDWFNPSRAVFKFNTPTLNTLTTSQYAKSLTPIIRPCVMLNHSIRRLFEQLERYQAFVYGDVVMFRKVLPKFAKFAANQDNNVGSSTMPTLIPTPSPSQLNLREEEKVYLDHIFMMNAEIHQRIIGGADSQDEVCLYKAFRTARKALQDFKQGLKREQLPNWFSLLHIVAGALFSVGFWELMRWFAIW
jgi:hypothetical protein